MTGPGRFKDSHSLSRMDSSDHMFAFEKMDKAQPTQCRTMSLAESPMSRTLVTLAFLLATGPLFGAEIYRVSDANGFNRAVAAAKSGDKILLAPGEYGSNFHFRGVHGAAGKPIIIAAADPDKPAHFVGKTAPLHFSGASHLELKYLVVSGATGNGLNIDDAGDPDKPSHHITLRNIRVRDIGPRGNADGIKLSGVDDFLVEDCTVERWGSGGSAIDMVGCHRGLIFGCVFRKGGANAVQAKGGSAEITVRRCRFEDAGERAVNLGGSTGDASFRPRLKDFPENGKYEAKDVRVEGCTFVGGGASVAFVGVDGAVARYNTIYRPGRYAIRILQENVDTGFVPCRNGVFEYNVVVFRSDAWVTGGINVGANTSPKTFRFANNLWYCEDRPGNSNPKLPTVETDGVIGKNPQFVDPSKGDFGVSPDGPAHDRGAHALPAKGR